MDDEAFGALIFKEQFDKPILLNTRFLLTRDETRALLVTAWIGTQPTTAQRRGADRLDDLGNDLVRHLVPLLDDGEPEGTHGGAPRVRLSCGSWGEMTRRRGRRTGCFGHATRP